MPSKLGPGVNLGLLFFEQQETRSDGGSTTECHQAQGLASLRVCVGGLAVAVEGQIVWSTDA